MSQEQQETDLAAWGAELRWVAPERIEFSLVAYSLPLPETPRLEAYRYAVSLCNEDQWEAGLNVYEEILSTLAPDEFLLAQLACWGRSSALQHMERSAEAWQGLTALFAPGRSWTTPMAVLVNWLQTAVVVAAQVAESQACGALLQLCYRLASSYHQLGLGQRFGELLREAFQALAVHDLDEAVDWLDEIRQDWETEGAVVPEARLLLVEGLSELLEFEDAIEEAQGVLDRAQQLGYQEMVDEWSERIQELREEAGDPYNLARRGDRRALSRMGKVNQLGKSGRNALMGAVVANDLELALWLLERNANPNLIASDGWNPLLLAADHNHADMVSLLARWKADLGATNDLDQTSLHVVAWQDYQDTARRLLELGIEVGYCDTAGNTALHLAASEAVPEMIELLAQQLPVDVRNDCTESTPLMVAAESDHVENLELLIRLGADPKARDLAGKTALDYAKAHQAEAAAAFLRKL